MSAHAAVTHSVAGADRENRRELGVMAADNLWDDAACRDEPRENLLDLAHGTRQSKYPAHTDNTIAPP